ncbi:MAG: hypothetical protein ACE5FG_03925 [Myxococcota bacterium]
MLRTTLIEDLNRLARPEEQERLADDPTRAREALDRLRWIDTSELERFRREAWLNREELDLIERFLRTLAERLPPIPEGVDPVGFTRADPGWQVVRERARELLTALEALREDLLD